MQSFAAQGSATICHIPMPQAQIPVPRFAGSLARQMAIDEYRSLVNRTAARENGRPRCLCLVAVGPDDGVLGSLDLRLPQEATGLQPPGVPEVHDVTTTLQIVTIGHLDSTIRIKLHVYAIWFVCQQCCTLRKLTLLMSAAVVPQPQVNS